MHQTTGTNESWEIQTGKIGMHPAKRNGIPVHNRVRFIGVMPDDCGWVPGDRGMIAPMAGKSPGRGMLYLYPEEHIEQWLQDKEGRCRSDIATFQLQDTGCFGIYLNVKHPVIKAVRRAIKWQHFGHTDTQFYVNVTGDSMTVRVPNREDLQPYRPNGQRNQAQGRLF